MLSCQEFDEKIDMTHICLNAEPTNCFLIVLTLKEGVNSRDLIYKNVLRFTLELVCAYVRFNDAEQKTTTRKQVL